MPKSLRDKEQAKYQRLYAEVPEYNTYSPAESIAQFVIVQVKSLGCKNVLDAGCGKGQIVKLFHNAGINVTGVDHVSLDDMGVTDEVVRDRFKQANLSELPFKDNEFDYVLCVDVLEHIPAGEQILKNSIKEMARVCSGYALFKIALHGDMYGKRIGEKLHVTIMLSEDWIELLAGYFSLVHVIEEFNGNVTLLCRKRADN